MEWSQPEVQGDLVTPRAGHSGVTIGENWYIAGGGDNKNGCPETLVLNMSKLAWSALASVKERDPLASEGLSVCSVLIDGERHLVAFGGYNGKYNNEVFVMRLKPRDALRPKIFQSPAAAAAAASVSAAYALAKSEKLDFSKLNLNSNGTGKNSTEQDLALEIDALKEEKRVLELSLAEVRAENYRVTEKIDEVNGTHAELSKELHSVQGQLVAERSRCFKLEAQIAELQKMMESLQSIENEVQLLRRQKSALDQEIERSAAQRQVYVDCMPFACRLMMLKALQKRSKFCKIASNLLPFSSTSDVLVENLKSPSSIPPFKIGLKIHKLLVSSRTPRIYSEIVTLSWRSCPCKIVRLKAAQVRMEGVPPEDLAAVGTTDVIM
ncbi:hypothetical protein NC653_020103 [Populus alba x Populus x berolinensis]|uniref:Acyl-CoA-binding domain-containing protein n=1 Tax=Populus alba x Populus x berolinensis TaxID=444605 RepID=A0AAD6QDE3_9ROSI|nr:hypothetical protein NC653_020103 [Populus alba x Populus x berolinensis]